MTRRLLLVAGVLALVAGAGIIFAVPSVRWRVRIALLKMQGDLPELSWSDLSRMMRPGSHHDLSPLILTHNPFTSIQNPWDRPEDVTAGAKAFASSCARCHGDGGKGGSAPDLTSLAPARGASDWAVYRVIRNGVPGTAMPPHSLPEPDLWRLVAYVQGLRKPLTTAVPAGSAGWVMPPVTPDRLRMAESDTGSWLMYNGTFSGWRHSRLAQINRATVTRLHLSWVYQTESATPQVETTPIVNGDMMYVTEPGDRVVALDAVKGTERWSYQPVLPDDLLFCCGPANRGVAILDSTLFLGTLDARLIALDARTGRVRWETRVANHRDGFSITSAPLVLGDRVIIGIAGGEYGTRGFIDAYAPETGKQLWRFNTIPEPGSPGSETWTGNSWRRGGGPAWLTGAYDPALDLLYMGVGNPGPLHDGTGRPGDNLFTDCVVALEPATGRLRWYFQFTPHDEYDFDAVQIPLLYDADWAGRPRHLMLWANRNAFYYVLDRETGAFLLGRPFARQTWADGLDSTGRPLRRAAASPSRDGTLVYPSAQGATNWWSPSFSPRTGLVYVPVREQGGVFFRGNGEGQEHGDRGLFMGSRDQLVPGTRGTYVRALDALTGELRWEYSFTEHVDGKAMAGILSTAGDVVFAGAGTRLVALDARSGALLWDHSTGGPLHAAPITFWLHGHQYVTIAAGRAILTFGLD